MTTATPFRIRSEMDAAMVQSAMVRFGVADDDRMRRELVAAIDGGWTVEELAAKAGWSAFVTEEVSAMVAERAGITR